VKFARHVLPLCEAAGCRNRLLDAGKPGLILRDGQSHLLCGACAEIFALGVQEVGAARGRINGMDVDLRVLLIEGGGLPSA